MSLLLGVDLGTSYFKVGLFDRTGALRGLGRVHVPKQAPAPGRRELPVEEFWILVREAFHLALDHAHATVRDIAGLSYSSQANSFVLLDGHDTPLTPIVLWTDTRAERIDEAVSALASMDEFPRQAGFGSFAVESAVCKWRWFQRHEPALWARARRVLTISDYFTLALTGQFVGDASTASFLGLYDLRARAWWPWACAQVGVEPRHLATPIAPGTRAGVTTLQAKARLGLPEGIPLAVGGLDHHVAAVGAGIEQFGAVSLSTGTVLAALTLVDAPIPAPGCYHGPHVDGRRFYRIAFDPRGAAQLEDYRSSQAPTYSLDALIACAISPEPVAIDARRHAAHVRLILEQIGITHRWLIQRVQGENTAQSVVVGGGAMRNRDCVQFLADALQLPLVVPASPEPACLGAALFAAVAAGWHHDVAEAALAMLRTDRTVQPHLVTNHSTSSSSFAGSPP